MSRRRLKAYVYLTLVAVIWGAAGPVIKFTLQGIDPFPFLAYRFAISAIFSVFFFLVKGINFSKLKSVLPFVFIYGLLATTIALGTLFVGLDNSTVLDMTLIGTIGPLVVVAGGALLFRDHITKREKIGMAIVIGGASINALAPIILNNSGVHLTGNLFLLAFLLSDSAAILLAKKLVRKKIPSITLTNLAFIIGAITMVPFVLYSHGTEFVQQIIQMPIQYHLGVWYMALFSGTLAYFLFVRGQKSIEVSEAILFNYLQPLFAVPLAIFWLGEKLTPTFVIGASLITTGIIVAEFKKSRKIASKTHS